MNKICFHVERNIKDWFRIKSIDQPIYPIPGSLMNELSKKNIFSFFSRSIILNKNQINKYKIYNNFNEMLNNTDIYITTGGHYINFLFSNYTREISKLITKKAIPILYRVPTSKKDLNFYKYQLIYKFSRVQIYTSISQFEYAKKHKIGSPIFLPIGIDTQFYNSKKSSNLKNWLLNKKYIVMHGDEDRNHIELIKIADFLKIGIIRISQYIEKDKHKNSIFNIASKSQNIKFLYHFQNVNFDDYITILKNAYLYCGSVKSNISPNGWTAICEAKALNIPILAKKGFTTEDFKKVFAKEDNRNFIEISNIEDDKNKILNFYYSLDNLKLNKKYSPMTDYIHTSKIFHSQLIENGIISN